jgi:hypothetical protein
MRKFFTFFVMLAFVGLSVDLQAQTPETVTDGKGNKYVASEIKQLVDFLNLPSLKKGLTNAQAFGYSVKVTMDNVDEWGNGCGYSRGVYIGNIYNFTKIGDIYYIGRLEIQSPSEYKDAVRLAGHLQIQNFKYLKLLSCNAPFLGDKMTVKDCPNLQEFYLSRPQWEKNEKDPLNERLLEIKNCPALKTVDINCYPTEFVTDDHFMPEYITITQTNIPCIDFSKQKRLKSLKLSGNKFTKITLPNRAEYGENMYEGDFSYNAIEPIQLIPLISAYYGDSLFYDEDYNTGEMKLNSAKTLYLNNVLWHNIIACDPVTGMDTFAVGSKIDLSSLAKLQYGVPAVASTGKFQWSVQGPNVEGNSYPNLPETAEMKKGILVIPNNLMGTTITCTYMAPPLCNYPIKYIIYVSKKAGKAVNYVPNKSQP